MLNNLLTILNLVDGKILVNENGLIWLVGLYQNKYLSYDLVAFKIDENKVIRQSTLLNNQDYSVIDNIQHIHLGINGLVLGIPNATTTEPYSGIVLVVSNNLTYVVIDHNLPYTVCGAIGGKLNLAGYLLTIYSDNAVETLRLVLNKQMLLSQLYSERTS